MYDETSPTCLRWAVDVYGGRNHNIKAVSAGDIAGAPCGGGYYSVMFRGKSYLAHRVVFEIAHCVSLSPGQKIDHENGQIGDNRLSNLRLVSVAVNSRNCKKTRANTSGITGVSKYKSVAWIATWSELDGTQKTRSFSRKKYGDDAARELATKARADAIALLNASGAGYTERHGT